MTNDQIAALLNDAYISNPILSADTVEVESYLRDAAQYITTEGSDIAEIVFWPMINDCDLSGLATDIINECTSYMLYNLSHTNFSDICEADKLMTCKFISYRSDISSLSIVKDRQIDVTFKIDDDEFTLIIPFDSDDTLYKANTILTTDVLYDAVEQLKVCTDLETISKVLNMLKSKGEK